MNFKKALRVTSRTILIIYAALPIISFIVESFNYGFSFKPFLIFLGLSLFGGSMAFLAFKKPKFGGVFFTFLGLFIIVMALNTEIGIDLRAILIGGLPIILTGLALVYEGFISEKEINEYNDKLL